MRRESLTASIFLGMTLLIILSSGCSNKKVTTPIEPVTYLMKDYFPLSQGDQWIWEVTSDTIIESYSDGDISWGEPFVDLNQNGIYDFGEQYQDLNYNGKYDGPNDPWTPDIPYDDRNSNGTYDPPNGVWDPGEQFNDFDGDGVCGIATTLNLKAYILSYKTDNQSIRTGSFQYTSYYDSSSGGMWADTDYFSNDSLGLRWHGHTDRKDLYDLLATLQPISMANEIVQPGDTIVNIDTSFDSGNPTGIHTWNSTFEMIEDVTVPAGSFEACLKFRSIASEWTGNMKRYNGTSYQWYAKDVGLVKSEGPGEGEHWLLKSAEINGKNYP
jgi:hypothetical protein